MSCSVCSRKAIRRCWRRATGDSIGDIFEAIARRRGFLRAGGEIDEERTAAVLLDEFRGGRIGRITLD